MKKRTLVASLDKIILLEKIPPTKEPGIPLYPPNYTKDRKLDIYTGSQGRKVYNSDLESEVIKGKSSVNKHREIKIL